LENSASKEIYFHVGTGKTGTTFLQYRVFPKLVGIQYIQRTQYHKAVEIIARSKHKRILVSREFDQQLEFEISRFSARIPYARPIIVFRRHDSYIASQYRRFIKNGFTGSFSAFFDVINDTGKFKKHDLEYCRQVKLLQDHFSEPPVVLIYDDLQRDPKKFIESLAARMNTTIEFRKVDTSSKHRSYSEKQLKALRFVATRINLLKGRRFKNNVLDLFSRLYLATIRYGTLYLSTLFPDSWFSPEPLITQQELEAVRLFYEADWNRCKELANVGHTNHNAL
jgi:hypothetical protein